MNKSRPHEKSRGQKARRIDHEQFIERWENTNRQWSIRLLADATRKSTAVVTCTQMHWYNFQMCCTQIQSRELFLSALFEGMIRG